MCPQFIDRIIAKTTRAIGDDRANSNRQQRNIAEIGYIVHGRPKGTSLRIPETEQLDGRASESVSGLGKPFGEFGFLGDVGCAFKVERVAVGVFDDSDPHIVADLRLARLDAAGCKFAVQGKSILALLAYAGAVSGG